MKRVHAIFQSIALALPAGSHAQPLERLFFSPTERKALEAQWRAPRPAALPAGVSFEGYVQRRGGAATVWINGKAQPASSASLLPPEGSASLRSGVVEVNTGQAEAARLRVGDALGADERAWRSLAERGAVIVHR